MTPAEMLDIEFECDSFDNPITVRDYLCELLFRLWEDPEGFSGKRPFGNSGWYIDLYHALCIAGLIDGDIDEDGYVNRVDSEAGWRLIQDCIGELHNPTT